jgi:branched-subunit amino acid aminotransferase/4-amino-4-deoxychorismate lyase
LTILDRTYIRPNGISRILLIQYSFLFSPDPVRLALDSIPTSYGSPFLQHKTTKRRLYDDARDRVGATLRPSKEPTAPPFDVLLYNPDGQVTETSIANFSVQLVRDGRRKWITPPASCGLLPGVARAELLEKGIVEEGIVTLDELVQAAKARAMSLPELSTAKKLTSHCPTERSANEMYERRTWLVRREAYHCHEHDIASAMK